MIEAFGKIKRKLFSYITDWFYNNPFEGETFSLDYSLAKFIRKRLLMYYKVSKNIIIIDGTTRKDILEICLFFKEYEKYGPELKEASDFIDNLLLTEDGFDDEKSEIYRKLTMQALNRRMEIFEKLGSNFANLWN